MSKKTLKGYKESLMGLRYLICNTDTIYQKSSCVNAKFINFKMVTKEKVAQNPCA